MERLKARRSARRAQNTSIVNDASRILQDSIPDLARVRSIKDRLTTSHAELQLLDGEIEPLIPTQKLERECTATAEIQDEVVMVIRELDSKIEYLQSQRIIASAASTGNQTGIRDSSARRGSKLPKLELSTLDGELSNWLTFWEQLGLRGRAPR
ncbi:hypothetical protein HPB47_016219 [Ixodes persulcatus]|uniref:Uncharacterized protein n=1 Tax=Ixodes persulcatus TaxID=34615 RepID=A0AC60R0L9_IXOPE|nr:hypothetical protein HPB47_016219 [Ixodes persulcatus]